MRRYSFCVNTDPDEEKARQALRDLRRTVLLGRIAEKALHDLKTQGSHPGRVRVISGAPAHYSMSVETLQFPKFVTVQRSDIPDYGLHQISFGKVVQGEHGGHLTEEVQVHLHCHGWFNGEWKKMNLHIGQARIKTTNEVVFVHRLYFGKKLRNGYTSKLYKSQSNPQAVRDYSDIARTLAYNTIRFHEHEAETGKIQQSIHNLRSHLAQWLVEDGHVENFCNFLRRNAAAAAVMNS
jgi:hypothetical protein